MKGFGYYSDASMVGICRIPDAARLSSPVRNPEIDRLAEKIRTQQPKTLASGIEVIMADLKEAISAPRNAIDHHTHAIVLRSSTTAILGRVNLNVNGFRRASPTGPASDPPRRRRFLRSIFACWDSTPAPVPVPRARCIWTAGNCGWPRHG